MFVIEGVSVAYDGRTVLDRVTAELGPGPVAVTGPSGSGKSTLLRILAGHQRPDSGSVSLKARPVVTSTWKGGSDPRIAFVHQDYRLVPFLTAAENLLLAAEVRGIEATPEQVEAALARVGLDGVHAGRLPGTLSGGEQQRVAIARALLCGASALVADEPTGALDAANTRKVAEVLTQLAAQTSMQLVVATHDPMVADMLPTRWHLCDGILEKAAP